MRLRVVEEEDNNQWWEKGNPPAPVELERFIRNQPSLRLFGNPMNEEVKDDIMLALRTAWEVLKNEKAKKQPESQVIFRACHTKKHWNWPEAA